MKTYLKIIFIKILILAPNLYAQLRLNKEGDIIIGNSESSSWLGSCKLEITEKDKTLEQKIFVSSNNIARLWTVNKTFAFAFGIDEKGEGHIYKHLHTPSSIMTFKSNGYFGIGKEPSYKFRYRWKYKSEYYNLYFR